ncbi:hypothetical protein GQR58_018087 [Nymphon striatum]|nr:hypothetical protein GQR58_018087 [Nymphon striatum]
MKVNPDKFQALALGKKTKDKNIIINLAGNKITWHGFFSRGRTMACFKLLGNFPVSNDEFTISVRRDRILGRPIFKNTVGIGSKSCILLAANMAKPSQSPSSPDHIFLHSRPIGDSCEFSLSKKTSAVGALFTFCRNENNSVKWHGRCRWKEKDEEEDKRLDGIERDMRELELKVKDAQWRHIIRVADSATCQGTKA